MLVQRKCIQKYWYLVGIDFSYSFVLEPCYSYRGGVFSSKEKLGDPMGMAQQNLMALGSQLPRENKWNSWTNVVFSLDIFGYITYSYRDTYRI